jgi:hypothetical protein
MRTQLRIFSVVGPAGEFSENETFRAMSGMVPKREMSESGYGTDGLRLKYALTCGRLR